MTPPQAARESLRAALAALADGPLRAGAAGLFGALGYRSERTLDLGSAEAVVALLAELAAEKGAPLTDKRRALFAEWRDAELLFQFSDSEIAGARRGGDKFDSGRVKSFLFAAVDLPAGPRSRTRLADTARAVNACLAMPAVVLFRHGGTATLAAVHRRAHKRDDGRDVLEKVTLVKDVACAAPHRAHLDILAALALPRLAAEQGARDFDGLHRAWERALDIEALNRRFYRELFAWFERAAAECRFPDDGAGPGSAERHVIRLVTRMLFVWFLAEKGLAPRELFTEGFARRALKAHAPDGTDYYRAVLQNLFFATLNTEIPRRGFGARGGAGHRDFTRYRYRGLLADPGGFVAKLREVPFVNGGLFDCLDDFAGVRGGGRRIDAFTDNPAQGKDLRVPARLFFDDGGLFPLFRGYKFTVEENTPLDREVALDPELLGRAFENLLASWSEETRETARKATGSYYTPRHVVDYMAGAALAAALERKARPADGDSGFWRERLDYLLAWEAAYDDAGDLFDAAETESLVRAIAGLRILDPAVGSGAFPMGALHRLTLALRRLDPGNALWERLQKEQAHERAGAAFDAGDEAARAQELLEINRLFETYRTSDYGRKLYLIQNGLFGVDLQPVACQIAKLRVFVSLVIEQEKTGDAAENYGIRPLPNLETRFVAADALLGLGGAGAQGVLGDDVVTGLRERLRRVREGYFNARTREAKRARREEDQRLRAALAAALEALGFGHGDAEAVAGWDPYDQNAGSGWFDPAWMFGAPAGFDVVIGNPPYVRADFRGERHKAARRAIRDSGAYETLWQKWDMFVPFMERSFKLLAPGGVSSLIVSDAFGHAKYALKAREWFLRNACIERIDFYSRIRIFDAAVHNLSYLFRKADGAANAPLRRLHEPAFGDVTELATGKQADLDERAFLPADSWRAPAAPTIRLGELCYVSRGMSVHAHERKAPNAFTLEDVVRDERDDEHPKAFVQGKHLDRWLPRENRWLEWGTERAPALFSSTTFPELYGVGEKIIAQRSPGPDPKACYDDALMRYDASSIGFVLWSDLAGVRNRSIKKQARYRDENDGSELPKREALEAASRRFSIKYLLGVMNSSSALDFLRAHRRSNIHLYPDDWKALPVPDAPPAAQRPVVALVDAILAARRADAGADTAPLEAEIDEAVRALYGLRGGRSR